ncbi:MAG: hypothetical protein ACJAW3_001234 [Lentimonas sp.]|jgi:hypothetical protein
MFLLLKLIQVSALIFFSNCSFYNVGNKDSAKLAMFNSFNKKSFSFVVGEEFLKDYSDSKQSTSHPKMTKSELKLLKKFLRDNKYCFNKKNRLLFKINSRQEKVYDVTFSRLIEQSYNAKPISPVTYFGACLY